MASRYDEVHRRSLEDPEGFWGDAANDVVWYKKWDKVLDSTNAPFYRWFVGGETNTCMNALDRHVDDGRGEQLALIYDSPVTGSQRKFTFRELRDEVALFAGVLADLGVGMGDRVIVYMPMIPEAAIAMLACTRIGAVHSVVFGGFAPHELATRIDDATPKVIVSASCGIEVQRVIPYKPLLDAAIERAKHKPDHCIVKRRPQQECELTGPRDVDWDAAMAKASPRDCVPVKATDPCYILYTSGTTGQPKGVIRDTGGHIVALKWSMHGVYAMDPGDVYWAASDVGWVVGHSYIVYAPLFHGCTSILFEGKPVGTPDAGVYWRVIAEHGVNALFTAPTAFRAIKGADPEGKLIGQYDLSKFRTLFLAGERSDTDTVKWAERVLDRPVIDHYWQTESGWPMLANCVGLGALPVKHGSPTKPVPGYDIQVLDPETHEILPDGQIGAICIRLPLPPSCLPTLWNADQRFIDSYLAEFPGWYKTADAGMRDEDGYFYVLARTDDIINVAGHRLSTGGMEEILSQHKDVAECAVVGVHDDLKGQVPVGFIVLKSGVNRPGEEVVKDVVQMVRDEIGAVASFRKATIVPRLPKTRSGKILRGTISKIADSEAWKMPATIDDPGILDEIENALKQLGYATGTPAEK